MDKQHTDITAKEYLSQVYRIDLYINSMLEHARMLRESATKATATLSDMPRSSSPTLQSVEDIVIKYVDLEREIAAEVDAFVNKKREIKTLIERMPSLEYQALLTQRYLCFKTWTHISASMGFDLRYIYRLHLKALEEFENILRQAELTIVCHAAPMVLLD